MLLCAKDDFRRYAALNSRFEALARLLGDELHVVSAPEAVTRPTAMLEAHRRYIDVQLLLEGAEGIGWAPLRSLSTEAEPFDTERDIVFFRDPPLGVHQVTPGHLAVFFPEDAHARLLGDGHRVHKCVFKVLVDFA